MHKMRVVREAIESVGATPIYLPTYSPELNPIERVWKLTRRQCLHNQYFQSLDEVVIAVEAVFDQWTRRNETLRRLCAIT